MLYLRYAASRNQTALLNVLYRVIAYTFTLCIGAKVVGMWIEGSVGESPSPKRLDACATRAQTSCLRPCNLAHDAPYQSYIPPGVKLWFDFACFVSCLSC